MAQIKKYKRGQELQQLDALDAQIQAAMATATDEQKAQAQKLAQNARAYQGVDSMTNRDERRFQIDMKKAILATLQGQQAYNPYDVGSADKNVFGYYSRPEITHITNEITSQTLYNPNGAQGTGSGSESGSDSKGRYVYTWNRGWNPLNINDESLTTKMSSLISHFTDSMISLLQANTDGKKIIGTQYGINVYEQALQNLQMLGEKLNDSTAKTFFPTLAKIAATLGMDQNSFDLYFGDTLPVATAIEQNISQLKKEGFDLEHQPTDLDQFTKELIAKYKYKIAVKDGKTYLFDENYGRLNGPQTHINYDYRSTGYNHGIMTDENGLLWKGDVTKDFAGADPEDPFYKQFQTWLKGADGQSGIYKQQDDLFTIGNQDSVTGQQHEVRDIYDFSEHQVVMDAAKFFRQTTGKNMKYVDVSRLFAGDQEVIVATKSGKDIPRDMYGNIKLNDPDLIFYYQGKDGQTHPGNFSQVEANVGAFRHTGYGETDNGSAVMTDLLAGRDLSDTTIDGDNYMDGGDNWFSQHWKAGAAGATAGAAAGAVGGSFLPGIGNVAGAVGGGAVGLLAGFFGAGAIDEAYTQKIKDDPYKFVNNVFDVLLKEPKNRTAEENALLSNLGLANNPKAAVNSLINFIQAYELEKEMSPEMRQKYIALMRKYKQGGTLTYAKMGARLDVNGNPVGATPTEDEQQLINLEKDITSLQDNYGRATNAESAKAALEDRKVMDDFQTEDFIRMGTVAADIASMVAAFCGPYGMAASGIIGLGSTVGNVAADLMDESVSAGEMLTGLGIGIGTSILGMIPGWGAEATGIRTLKTVARYVPKVINLAMAGMVTLNPETIASLKKAVKGDVHEKLTVKDWRNISYAFQAVAGLTRGGRGAYLMKQGKNQAKIKVGKGPEMSVLDENGKSVKIPKEHQEAFRKALADDDVVSANEMLKAITGKEDAAIKTETSKKYRFFGEEETHIADKISKETPQEIAYDWSKLDPEQFGSLDDKLSNANWVKQAVAADQARGWNPFTWRRRAQEKARANDTSVSYENRKAETLQRFAEHREKDKPVDLGITAEQRAQKIDAYNKARQDAETRRKAINKEYHAKKKAYQDWESQSSQEYKDFAAKHDAEKAKFDEGWKSTIEAEAAARRNAEDAAKYKRWKELTAKRRKSKAEKEELTKLNETIAELKKQHNNGRKAKGAMSWDQYFDRDFEAEFNSSSESAKFAEYQRRSADMQTKRDEASIAMRDRLKQASDNADAERETATRKSLEKLRQEKLSADPVGTLSQDVTAKRNGSKKTITVKKNSKITNLQHYSQKEAEKRAVAFQAAGGKDVVELDPNSYTGAKLAADAHITVTGEPGEAGRVQTSNIRKILYNKKTKEVLVMKNGAKLDKLQVFVNNK